MKLVSLELCAGMSFYYPCIMEKGQNFILKLYEIHGVFWGYSYIVYVLERLLESQQHQKVLMLRVHF